YNNSSNKHKSTSDILQSFQKKSQFRTIAPKMVPKILTSGVVSCLQSSVPEQNPPKISFSSFCSAFKTSLRPQSKNARFSLFITIVKFSK
uniref:Uncharacterized protein n=1 Tax=Anas zonorhyncha TaxID=75864 RepID=A0A8B9ZV67_9AVES